MATGRMLKAQISLSERVNELPIMAALLFTWMIPHADDFGRMRGSAKVIKAMVVPMRDDMLAADVDKCLIQMVEIGLIERYTVGPETFIQFPKFDTHQQGLHKRTKSKFPDPEDVSRKFPEIPASCARGTEQNRTEQEQKSSMHTKSPADADPIPPATPPDKREYGTKLPKDWVLPKKWGDWALAEIPGWNAERVRLTAERFKDHWMANANRREGKKADWEATWRNWCRGDYERARPPNGKPSPHILPTPGTGAYGKTTPMTADEAAELERQNAIDPIF